MYDTSRRQTPPADPRSETREQLSPPRIDSSLRIFGEGKQLNPEFQN